MGTKAAARTNTELGGVTSSPLYLGIWGRWATQGVSTPSTEPPPAEAASSEHEALSSACPRTARTPQPLTVLTALWHRASVSPAEQPSSLTLQPPPHALPQAGRRSGLTGEAQPHKSHYAAPDGIV